MGSEDHPVREIIQQVVESTRITADQVRSLEDFVKADWVVDHEEAKFLFKVNRALGQNHDDCPEWTEFFVRTVCRLIVMDMDTPGHIDEEEGDWLDEMFTSFAVDNDSEHALLAEIRKTTTQVDGKFAARLQG